MQLIKNRQKQGHRYRLLDTVRHNATCVCFSTPCATIAALVQPEAEHFQDVDQDMQARREEWVATCQAFLFLSDSPQRTICTNAIAKAPVCDVCVIVLLTKSPSQEILDKTPVCDTPPTKQCTDGRTFMQDVSSECNTRYID